MQEIIGLLGVKGAGKDTAAAVMVKHFGFRRVAFADALYRETAEAFGVTVEFLNNRDTKETPQSALCLANCRVPGFIATVMDAAVAAGLTIDLLTPLSARYVLQLWGTEYRRIREGYDSYWLDRVNDIVDRSPSVNFIATDVRFINEARYIEHRPQGRLVRVRRPELEEAEARNRAAKGTAAHRSEVELLTYPTSFEVLNLENHQAYLETSLVFWYEHTRRIAA